MFANAIENFLKSNKDSLLRALIYTIGHFCIALASVLLITGATFFQAVADATLEPAVNAVWYFILDYLWNRYFGHVKELISILIRTTIYTVGHISIAITMLMLITGTTFYSALTDAIIEPLINGLWYFILDYIWKMREDQKAVQVRSN